MVEQAEQASLLTSNLPTRDLLFLIRERICLRGAGLYVSAHSRHIQKSPFLQELAERAEPKWMPTGLLPEPFVYRPAGAKKDAQPGSR